MKRIFIVVITLLIIVSCSKSNEPSIVLNEDNDMKTFDETLGIIYPVDNKYYIRYDEWRDYFEKIHGIKLEILFNQYYLPETLSYRPKDGILYLNEYYNYYIFDQIYNYEMVDLKPYYDKYNWYNSIEQKYIDGVSKDGSIYAIPSVGESRIIPRYYNNDYLDELNVEVPKTIDEFTDYLSRAKLIDTNMYPLIVSYNGATRQLGDVLKAYGIYANSYEEEFISLNPKTNTYEDAVFCEEFSETLIYLDMLLDTQIMKLSYDNSTNLDDYIVASEYNLLISEGGINLRDIYNIQYPEYEYQKGYYLEGKNKEKLIEIRKDITFYVFPKNLTKSENKIEMFNNIFFNDKYYFDLKYGIENKDYQLEFGEYVPKSIGKEIYLNLNQITSKFNNNFGNEDILKLISEATDEMIYERNIYTNILTYSTCFKDISYNFLSSASERSLGYMLSFLDLNVTVEQVIESYKKKALKSGIYDYVKAFNEKINATPVYDYEY